MVPYICGIPNTTFQACHNTEIREIQDSSDGIQRRDMNKLIIFPTSVGSKGINRPPVRVAGPSVWPGAPGHTPHTAGEYLRWPGQQSARREEDVTWR